MSVGFELPSIDLDKSGKEMKTVQSIRRSPNDNGTWTDKRYDLEAS